MDSRFRGNDGQTATASVKVTCLAEMTSFPRKRESISVSESRNSSSTKRRRIVRRPAAGSLMPDSRERRVLGSACPFGHGRPARMDVVGLRPPGSAGVPPAWTSWAFGLLGARASRSSWSFPRKRESMHSWERGRPARMDDQSGLRPVAGVPPALPDSRPASGSGYAGLGYRRGRGPSCSCGDRGPLPWSREAPRRRLGAGPDRISPGACDLADPVPGLTGGDALGVEVGGPCGPVPGLTPPARRR